MSRPVVSGSNATSRFPVPPLSVRSLTRPDHLNDMSANAEVTEPLALVPPQSRALRGAKIIAEQQRLDLEFASPTPFIPVIVPTELHQKPLHRTSPSWEPEQTDDGFFERQPTGRALLPEPEPWAKQYAQAWVEANIGKRPARQLRRWSSPAVLAKLAEPEQPASPRRDVSKTRQARKLREPHSIVSSVQVGEPADGIAEVAAVVRSQGRSRALMLRFEGWDGRWICTFAAMV